MKYDSEVRPEILREIRKMEVRGEALLNNLATQIELAKLDGKYEQKVDQLSRDPLYCYGLIILGEIEK